jgi:hypothetical protein
MILGMALNLLSNYLNVMIDPNRTRVALIIKKIKHDSQYLTNNFFYQNALNTFIVLNKIRAIDHRLITVELLAHVTKFLLSLEVRPGGPYAENNSKPDPKLNAEIAYFLNKQGINLPALEPFIPKITIKKEYFKIFDHIYQLANKSLLSLPKSFQNITGPKIKAIVKGDQDQQILLLAHFFKLSLGNCGAQIKSETIYQLGLANLFLWLSYSLYDNIIDDDDSIDSLPIANWAAREFACHINQLKTSTEYKLLFKKIMARMDYTQVWEKKYARFKPGQNFILSAQVKNYQEPPALYAKSLAHALGPMLILDQLKYPPQSALGQNILSFFKYYLSIRQMQDDIYDFNIDYRKGIITSANVRIIKNQINPKQLSRYFIKKELPRLQAKIIKYQKAAEYYLKKSTIIKYPDYLKQFLLPLQIDQQKIESFLSTYRGLND